MRILVIGLFLLTISSTAISQITVEYDVYKYLVESGWKYHKATNAEGKTFDLGKVGGKHNKYDFTQFSYYDEPSNMRFASPAGSPHIELYGTATHMKHKTEFLRGEEVDEFLYYRLVKDGFYILGGATTVGGEVVDFSEKPPLPLMKFPLSFGSNWEHMSTPEVQAHKPGFTQQLRERVDVIAAGTLKTPAGTNPCLVFKRERFILRTSAESVDSTGWISYTFITKGGISATIYVDKASYESTSPVIESASYITKRM
jgi:hypothetical protein